MRAFTVAPTSPSTQEDPHPSSLNVLDVTRELTSASAEALRRLTG
ncbi:MAG TPA: hypothetical protein VHX88_04835 [Solirubrobacteraceae bacterium]|nr:hypothetical protein [Solirubrobacteraceae bacterium]